MTFLRFSRLDPATRTATIEAGDLVLPGRVLIFAMGKAGSVGDARADGDKISLSISDATVWRLIADRVYSGVEATAHAIGKGARALQALLLIDRPDTNQKGMAMFAKSARPAPGSSYRICDTWGNGPRRPDGPAQPSLAEFAKMGWFRKSVAAGAVRDPFIFAGLDPEMRSRVFEAARNSANGIKTADDKLLEQTIENMLEAGQLDPMVAAALLRLINTAPIMEIPDMAGATARDISNDEATEGGNTGRRFYDPTGPSPGKAAAVARGRFNEALRRMELGHLAR